MKKLLSSLLLTATVSLCCAQKNQDIIPQHEGLRLLQENDQLSLKAIQGIQQIQTLKKIEQVYIAMLYHQNKMQFQCARDMLWAIERYLWSLEDSRTTINQERNITEKQLDLLRKQNSSLRKKLKSIDKELNEDQAMLSYYERFL